jgi:hypothetical protein
VEAVHGRTAKEDINALLDSIAHPTSSPLSLEEVASHPFTSLTCPYVRHLPFFVLCSFFRCSFFVVRLFRLSFFALCSSRFALRFSFRSSS